MSCSPDQIPDADRATGRRRQVGAGGRAKLGELLVNDRHPLLVAAIGEGGQPVALGLEFVDATLGHDPCVVGEAALDAQRAEVGAIAS